MARRMTIGNVVTQNTHTIRNTYEVAAWYQDVEIKQGLIGNLVYTTASTGYVHFPSFPGKAVASDFTSLFGGVPVGSKVNEDVGKDATARGSTMYGYQLAKLMLENEGEEGTLHVGDLRLTLDPRLGAEWHTFTPYTPEGEEPRDDITIPRLLWEDQPIRDAIKVAENAEYIR